MRITPEQLQELMQDVEQEDPIDFADLPFEDQALRSLVASHLCEMSAGMESFTEQERHLALLAVSAKLVLENLVLHIRLLRRDGIPLEESANALLQRLRGQK